MSARERGKVIAAETRELAQQLQDGRERYWRALLARPQMATAIVHAIKLDLDSVAWGRKLAMLARFGRELARTRRAAQRHRYRRASVRAAVWLASKDRKRAAANACQVGIGLWAVRQLPAAHRWGVHRIHPARTKSRAWQGYWAEVMAARQACETARNRIVVANEGLVIAAIRKWTPWAVGHLGEQDLMQAGREGVMTAADRYDPHHAPPVAFSTYATWWMRHEVFRLHQLQRSDLRAPIAVQALAQNLHPLMLDHPGCSAEHLAKLWDQELDRRAERRKRRSKSPTLAAVKAAIAYTGHRGVSFDQPIAGDPGGRTLAEMVPDQQAPADELLHEERIMARLLGELDQLDERDRRIITARYGLDGPERSARELTREGWGTLVEIEQVEERALAHLRGQMVG